MKVILTGSTGMIGKGVLLACLDRSDIEQVLVINRRSLQMEHMKLKEILLDDFLSLDGIQEDLAGYDSCLFCLGTSSVGKSEEAYYRITYELTTSFAKLFLKRNPNASFCYVSGAGTDSSEQGRMMWARVKGKTENELLQMPFASVHMFRPGYIQPLRGIKSSTGWYNAIYTLVGFLYPLLKRLPKYVTDTTAMATAMIDVAKNGYSKPILESIDINEIVRLSNSS